MCSQSCYMAQTVDSPLEKAWRFSPQMHANYPWNHKETTMGTAHDIEGDSSAVGDPMTVTQKVTAHRLEWLGHLARMPEHCIPQKCACLFGWLPQACPQGGLTRRWRDVIRADLRVIQIPETSGMRTHVDRGWNGIPHTGRHYQKLLLPNHHAELLNHQPRCPVRCAKKKTSGGNGI